jgi:hypothetical protein
MGTTFLARKGFCHFKEGFALIVIEFRLPEGQRREILQALRVCGDG